PQRPVFGVPHDVDGGGGVERATLRAIRSAVNGVGVGCGRACLPAEVGTAPWSDDAYQPALCVEAQTAPVGPDPYPVVRFGLQQPVAVAQGPPAGGGEINAAAIGLNDLIAAPGVMQA